MPPRTPSPARRRPADRCLALVLAATLAVAASCSGDGSDARLAATTAPPTSTTVPAEGGDSIPAVDDLFGLTEACNAAKDLTTAETSEAARDAGLGALLAIQGGEQPDDAVLDGWADDIDALRTELTEVRAALEDVEVAPDLARAWDAVTTAGDEQIEVLGERAELLRSHDADRLEREWPPVPDGTDQELVASLREVGVGPGDCEGAFAASTVPADAGRRFSLDAADACTAVVGRRQSRDFEATMAIVLEDGVAAVLQDGAVPADRLDAVVDAVDTARREWEETQSDLAEVDAADAPDPAAWQQVLGVAADRVQGFRQRSDALASGDADEIARTFRPSGVFEEPGFEGFATLGLDRRDCGALSS